jgi:hypothetical protein
MDFGNAKSVTRGPLALFGVAAYRGGDYALRLDVRARPWRVAGLHGGRRGFAQIGRAISTRLQPSILETAIF